MSALLDNGLEVRPAQPFLLGRSSCVLHAMFTYGKAADLAKLRKTGLDLTATVRRSRRSANTGSGAPLTPPRLPRSSDTKANNRLGLPKSTVGCVTREHQRSIGAGDQRAHGLNLPGWPFGRQLMKTPRSPGQIAMLENRIPPVLNGPRKTVYT